MGWLKREKPQGSEDSALRYIGWLKRMVDKKKLVRGAAGGAA